MLRQWVVIFLFLALGVGMLTGNLDLTFRYLNFWDYHGILYLGAISFFPRITMFITGLPVGGIGGWLCWLLAPRLFVAVFATLNYWHKNPVLVVMSWMIALSGESSEKYVLVRRSSFSKGKHKGWDGAKWV